MGMRFSHLLLSLPLMLISLITQADEFDRILSKKTPPPGVVIEIVSDDDDLLVTLMPKIKTNIEMLRKKFPDLPIAIVSHGSEQFAMTRTNVKENQKAHTLVETLVKEDNINFHVCGTHASWYNVMPEDFPEYVDVSPAGPTQIDDYEEMGYELIVLP